MSMRSPCNAHAEYWGQPVRESNTRCGNGGEEQRARGCCPCYGWIWNDNVFTHWYTRSHSSIMHTPTLYLCIYRLPASTTMAALDPPCPPPPLAPCVSRRGIVISAVCIALSSASGALIDARHGCCPKRTTGWMHQCGWAAERYERRNESPGSLPIECACSVFFLPFYFFCVWASERGTCGNARALACSPRPRRVAPYAHCAADTTSAWIGHLRRQCRRRSCTCP
ncbi:hypothetical protein B0H13DRAFT_926835 [Mycena leptocephala]|nr:hypothetical protein B0H13DRAFT_926835 [Mycena leptocephala]